jgi:hypothetical protein
MRQDNKRRRFLDTFGDQGYGFAMEHTLSSFIAHARAKGMDHATIRMLLLSAGWKEKDIAQALVAESLDVPVPVPPDVGGAREAFLHLFSFACLFTTLISLTVLFFQYLNRLFPDPAFSNMYDDPIADLTGIRWSLAAVIVTFPLFYWISRILNRDLAQHPERSRSAIRRWLIYITLLVTGLTLVGDVVTLVFYLLEGEITVRFLLKVFIVLLLAGDTFLYYLYSLRLPGRLPSVGGVTITVVLKWIALVTVTIALLWGMYLVGNPSTQRGRHLDDKRIEDLRNIQGEVYNYVWGNAVYNPEHQPAQLPKALPSDLKTVAQNAQYSRLNLNDPETGMPYEYRVTGPSTFELCATFSEERRQKYDISWDHPAGRDCFSFDALTRGMPKPLPVR